MLKYNIVKRSEINGVNTVYCQQKDCNSWVKPTVHQKGEGGEMASTLGKTPDLSRYLAVATGGAWVNRVKPYLMRR
jgi:hypothetical protein